MRRKVAIALWGVCAVVAVFTAATLLSLQPVSQSLRTIAAEAQTQRITDRNGMALTVTYHNRWNTDDYLPLYAMPAFLKDAFIFSEDKRFFDHGGVDWHARAAAVAQNIGNLHVVRGASTMTEQVVRMVTPRPRTLWSKWLEGIEAVKLERAAGKADIFEFYLNEVPYAANRRGVVQAARYYFARDIHTLTTKEMLALVVLVRAPSARDLYSNSYAVEKPLQALADDMLAAGLIDTATRREIAQSEIRTARTEIPVDARHFARYVRQQPVSGQQALRTTLDSSLQAQVQGIIDARVKSLKAKNVHNAAAIVIDHTSGEVLAWVSADAAGTPAAEIDAVLAPRQPGSAMKPFVYALALEKGWTAATLIDDAPLADAVGAGLHRFRNYSGNYYGPVTVREALGNSLNIPALLAVRHAGTVDYMNSLLALGFTTLTERSDVYDEGLALGNGAVSLFELARAYAAVANMGQYHALRVVMNDDTLANGKRIYSAETASIISDILSDPAARRLEFGDDSILNYPVQTAAKTGTSTDYRDAWTMAYNDHYVVGVWMGNLDYAPMNNVTGSTGPALAVRSIFSVLNRGREQRGLYMSPRLVSRDVCVRPADAQGECPTRTEWFAHDHLPKEGAPLQQVQLNPVIVRPTQGLQIAYDPRIPADSQKFRFEMTGLSDGTQVEWDVNGAVFHSGSDGRYLWPVNRGTYRLAATVIDADGARKRLPPVEFVVK